MDVALRGYRESDLAELCRLDEACFAEVFRFDKATMRRFIRQRNALVVVAEEGGLAGGTEASSIRGFVIVHLEGSGQALGGYVVTLDVDAGWRRKGLARQLMEEVERQALAAGAVWMGLHVFVENEGAISFYERAGYVRGEGVPGFYRGALAGERMDALVFRKWIG